MLGSPNLLIILVFFLIVFFEGSRGMHTGCVCVRAEQDSVHPHSQVCRNDALLHTQPYEPCSFCFLHPFSGNIVPFVRFIFNRTIYIKWKCVSCERAESHAVVHMLGYGILAERLQPWEGARCGGRSGRPGGVPRRTQLPLYLQSCSVPGQKTTCHVINDLPSLFHFWQRGYHLWLCGEPPPEDPDWKDSEVGRQQLERLENLPEWNASGKNHNDTWCLGTFWVPVYIWHLIWTSRSPVNQCRQVLHFNFVDEAIKAQWVIFKMTF